MKDSKLYVLVIVGIFVLFTIISTVILLPKITTKKADSKILKVGLISRFEGRTAILGMETYKAMCLCFTQNNINFVEICTVTAERLGELTEAYDILKNDVDDIYFLGITSSVLKDGFHQLSTNKALFFNMFANSDIFSFYDNNFICNTPNVESESKSIANYINSAFAGKKIVVIEYEGNPNFTIPSIKHFRNYLDTSFEVLRFDFKKEDSFKINRLLKNLKFDVIYLLAGGDVAYEAGLVAREIKKQNPQAVIIINPWASMGVYSDTFGDLAEGNVFPTFVPINNKLKKYREEFKTMYGDYPKTIHSLIGYEAMEILIEALNAGKRTPNQIKKFILEKDEFDTLLGKIKFDKYGDVVREYNFYIMKGGNLIDAKR